MKITQRGKTSYALAGSNLDEVDKILIHFISNNASSLQYIITSFHLPDSRHGPQHHVPLRVPHQPRPVPPPVHRPPQSRTLRLSLVLRVRGEQQAAGSAIMTTPRAMLSTVICFPQVTSTKVTRELTKELVLASVASVFMGFGTLFLMLWTGIYV